MTPPPRQGQNHQDDGSRRRRVVGRGPTAHPAKTEIGGDRFDDRRLCRNDGKQRRILLQEKARGSAGKLLLFLGSDLVMVEKIDDDKVVRLAGNF